MLNFQITLIYEAKVAHGPKFWQYCIANGAEWTIVYTFQGVQELLAFLKNGH